MAEDIRQAMSRPSILRMTEPLSTREGKLTLLALLMMLYVMALLASISVHELLGHGLFAALLGGDVYAFYLSPGSGFVSFWLPPAMTAAQVALVYMAGILVQLLIGTIVLFLVIPRIKNFMLGLFALMFCIGMTVHSSLYLFMGYIYDYGDTRYAASILRVQPDAFMVAGMIITGFFIIALSVVALRFLGRFMDLENDRNRTGALAIIWLPALLLSGAISFILSLMLPHSEMAYPLINSAILMLFVATALFLVPIFTEPVKGIEHRISFRSVLSVVICFMVILAGWAGIFGMSQESARGVLLHDPPLQVENFYSDYSLGNANLHAYSNGTLKIDIVLRNMMDSPSPLDEKIYRTFDRRPDWDRYIARSRGMLVTMFGLERSVGENLTFSTALGTARAPGIEDEFGRICTTYISLAGTRQIHMTPGELIPHPEISLVSGDYKVGFIDPWNNQGGYLDGVTVSWDPGMVPLEIIAWNRANPSIPYSLGSPEENRVGWSNVNIEESPANYRVVLNRSDD